MNIAMVHASLPSQWRGKEGGVTYFVHNLANKLVERGHAVTVFAFDERPPDAKYQVKTLSPAHWLHTNKLARSYLLPLLFARLKFRNFDIVHTHGDDWWLPAGREPRLRTMYGSALAEAQNSTNWKRRFNQRLIYQFEKIAIRKSNRTVGISQDTLRYFPSLNEVIGCGVDVSAFKPEQVNKSDEPTILYVGALEGRKRGQLVVDIFRNQIKPQLPNAQLWLVADKAVEGDGIMNFGKVSQEKLVELYQRAWVFCLPSTYEGFGIPYIEAMAAGTPVVATSNGGSQEILAGEQGGLICSEAELGSTLLALLNDSPRRQQLAVKGQQRAKDYDWLQIVMAYERVYNELATKPNLKVLAISHSAVVEVNQQLYDDLAKIPGVRVELIAPSHWVSEFDHRRFRTKALKGLNIHFYRLPVAFAGTNALHFYWWLPLRRIKKFRPDIIFLHQEPWSLTALQGLLLSFWLKSKLTFFTNLNFPKNHPAPFSWINGWVFERSVQALALSDEVEQVLRVKGYKGKINRFWFAVDTKLFQPQKEAAVNLKAELGLKKEALIIGYMGRLVKEKGVQVLLQAAALLEKESGLPAWQVLLVGDGAYKAELQQLLRQLGLQERVIFAGAVAHTQAAKYMNCLDIFVLPSLTTPRWKEQFGRVIIEALACGVPVVGSDSGEIPHLIRATGGGLIAHEGDETELAQCLQTLLCDPVLHQELVQQGMAVVEKRYSNEGVARLLANILQPEVGCI